jgi:hypothetical protein
VKSVVQASESGTERDLLVAMRRRVATAIDDPDTSSRDLAALTKRIREIVQEIKAWDARAKEEGESRGPVADEAFDASAL